MPQQWKLPGPASPYLVVWSYDPVAKDTHRHVPASLVRAALRGWIRSRRYVLREIYEALTGNASSNISGKSGGPSEDQLKARLTDAFLKGRLIVLTAESSTGHPPSKTKSSTENKVSHGPPLFPATRSASIPTGDKDTLRLGIVIWDKTPPLHFRSSPATVEGNIIGSLAFNTRVQILERLSGNWLYVSTLEHGTGYVAANYIWTAPEHPLFEPRVSLRRVEPYNKTTGKGTAIAIAQERYKVKFGQGLPFYVALLAVANRVPIPHSVEGWKALRLQADQYIWLPSQEFADGMRGRISSGSYTYELIDALGLADLVRGIQEAQERIAQFLDDLGTAIYLSGPYIYDAIVRHVVESLISILEALFMMAVLAILFLAVCAALGAWFGGGPAGAAVGFKIGTVLLEWIGLGFLVVWAADSIARIGSAFATFLGTVWGAHGNQSKLDQAARELAEAIGVCAGVATEVLVMWAAAKGVTAALKALKGTPLESAFGEGRLGSWLREAVREHAKAKPEIKLKKPQTSKAPAQETTLQFKTPAQTLRWLQARQLARDLGIPEGQRKGLLKATDPLEATIRAWTRKLARELGIAESQAEALLRSKNPRHAIFQTRARRLARELGIAESKAEALLRETESTLDKELGQSERVGSALRKALGDKAAWQRFTPELDVAFKNRLLRFRRRLDLSMDNGFSGQEGQIFDSEAEPGKCLKRWFKKALDKMPESIRLLEEAYTEVQANPKLRKLLEVVKVHERGKDWIVRDFDPISIRIKNAMGDPVVRTARARVVAELESLRAQGKLSKTLGEILKKIGREPPSDNIHWSRAKNKFIIIDMQ